MLRSPHQGQRPNSAAAWLTGIIAFFAISFGLTIALLALGSWLLPHTPDPKPMWLEITINGAGMVLLGLAVILARYTHLIALGKRPADASQAWIAAIITYAIGSAALLSLVALMTHLYFRDKTGPLTQDAEGFVYGSVVCSMVLAGMLARHVFESKLVKLATHPRSNK